MREPSCHWLVGPLIQTPCGRSTNPCKSSGQTGLRRLAHGVERARYVDCQTRFRRAQNLGSGTLVHPSSAFNLTGRSLVCAYPTGSSKTHTSTHPSTTRFPALHNFVTPSPSRPHSWIFIPSAFWLANEPNDKTTAPVESHPSLRRPAVSGDSVALPLPLSCSLHAMD